MVYKGLNGTQTHLKNLDAEAGLYTFERGANYTMIIVRGERKTSMVREFVNS